MSGPPTRVAVQVGGSTVRIACVRDGGEPWLVAELPGAQAGWAQAGWVRAGWMRAVADLTGPVPEELVLVHPASWTAARVAALARDGAQLARWTCTVAAPVAAARDGPRIVVDVGHTGAEVSLVGTDGSLLGSRTTQGGGAGLDQVLLEHLGEAVSCAPAEVRRLREELSLHPVATLPPVTVPPGTIQPGTNPPGPDRAPVVGAGEVGDGFAGVLGATVGVLVEMYATTPAPVLLIGGVARMPLLAELVDEAGIVGAVVAARPDAAAVLGALRSPRRGAMTGPHPVDAHLGPVRPRFPAPPVRRYRPVRIALAATIAALSVAALLALGTALTGGGAATADRSAGVLVQYGYRLEVPAGWEHTGGLPDRRRSLLTPLATPEGSDLIAVERTPLGYDAGAERERAAAELRAVFDAAVAAGSPLTDYDAAAHVAGRDVVTYRQRGADGRTDVDWFVVLDGDAQLSVGCQHTATGAQAVAAACDAVVGSIART